MPNPQGRAALSGLSDQFDAAAQADCLMRVAADQDRQAFKLLFQHFAPRIKAMMIKSGAAAAQADDLTQATMMNVWNKAHLYSLDRGAASTWIFTIARNARIDRLRRATSRPYDDVYELEIADDSAAPDERADVTKLGARVHEALTQLPPEQREIIELAYIEDLAHGDISARLNLPLGTVKSRLRLAYRKLQTLLGDLQ